VKISELPKDARDKFLEVLRADIELDLARGTYDNIRKYASDTDEFVRKNTYIVLGKIYSTHFHLKDKVYFAVDRLVKDTNSQIRHTAVEAVGELMKLDPRKAVNLLVQIPKADLLWLPREAFDLARRMGKKIINPFAE
jgi:hypothetical protein